MSFSLNPNEIPADSNEFAPLPDGKYCAVVHDLIVEDRQSQSGNEYTQARIQFRIVGDKHANRRVFKNCIVDHPSEKAAQIGQQFLRALWTAQGCNGDSITPENLECPEVVEIVLKTADEGQYGPRQNVVRVSPCKEVRDSDVVTGPSGAPQNNPW